MKRLTAVILSIILIISSAVIAVNGKIAVKPKVKVKNVEKGIELSFSNIGKKKIKIQRKTAKEKFKTIKKLSKKTSYIDEKITAGKTYSYKIICGKLESKVKKITRLKAPSIKTVGYDKKGMGFIWSKVKGAKGYEVYKANVKDNKTGKYTLIKTVTNNSLDNYEEKTKTTNKYKVRAINGNSKGLVSKPKEYTYVKRSKEGLDYSYTSKYAHINYSDVPYYGYGDPLEELYYTDAYTKTAKSRNETEYKDGFSYRSFQSGVEIACAPFEKTITIPETLGGKPVIKIGGEITDYEDGGYCYRESTWETDAEKVVISKNVKEIVSGTFESMPYLQTIEVSKDNPYYSSENGILYNKDKSVLLCVPLKNPNETINISEKTKTTYSLFSEETITLNIPKSVKKMKGGVLNSVFNAQDDVLYCMCLEEINVDKDNPNYSSENGVLYDKKKTKLILYPYSKEDTSYTLPDSVETIDYMLLDSISYLKTLTFNKKVSKIGFTTWGGLDFDNPLTVNVYKNTYAAKWIKSFNKTSAVTVKTIG